MSKKNIFLTLFIIGGCLLFYHEKGIAKTAKGNKPKEWTFYNKSTCGLIDDSVNCIAMDKDTLWIGTYNGVSHFNPKKNRWTNYTTHNGLADNYINTILVKNTDIWFGTKKGLTRFNKKKKLWTNYTVKDGLPSNQVNTLLNIENDLWIGTEIGLTSFNTTNNNFGAVYTTKDGLFDNRIKTLIRDGSNLLVGTVGAVINIFNLHTGKWEIQTPSSTLYSNIVLAVEKGFIWCGTNGGGIRRFSKSSQKWKNYTTSNGLCDNFVQSIANDGKYIWIGTFDGISLLNLDAKKWKTFSSKNGLSIGVILVDGNFVWFGTDEGIRRYNKQIPQVEIHLENSYLTKLKISSPLKIDCLISSNQKIKQTTIEYSTASFPDVWINEDITVTPTKRNKHFQIDWQMRNLPCLSDTYNIRLTAEDTEKNSNSSLATIKIDTIVPKITIDSDPAASLNIGLQNISGKYNKTKIKQIIVQPGNLLATLNPTNQTFTALINLEEGKNIITAALTDWLDRTVTTKSIIHAKAKAAPTIIVESIPSTKKKKEDYTTRLTLQETLLFDSGSAQIKEGGEEIINTVANFLKRYSPEKYSHLEIKINGHTDNVPIQKCLYSSNLKLSEARAHSVFESLIRNSTLSAESFSVKGYGETRPKTSNTTTKGRAKNRRVEIEITTKK
ncbi:OmpA family protein [bacterium]|nr:OmpA family protein [bacterium]